MARDEINAFLGSGTVYTGELTFEGAVRIDGIFKGRISSEGTLIVGQGAKIEGDINVGSIVVSGYIEGTIHADNKAVLHKTSQIQGRIKAALLVVEEGAQFDGEMIMRKGTANLESTPLSSSDENAEWKADKESLQ